MTDKPYPTISVISYTFDDLQYALMMIQIGCKGPFSPCDNGVVSTGMNISSIYRSWVSESNGKKYIPEDKVKTLKDMAVFA